MNRHFASDLASCGHSSVGTCETNLLLEDFRAEVVAGLSRRQKTLPCKLFYDEHGSNLFEQICAQKEYYPTRTELGIMRRHAADMARVIGPKALLVEYGSGSSLKTRVLLDNLAEPVGYVPIDISPAQLETTARSLTDSYPQIPIRPIYGDYTRPIQLSSLTQKALSTVAYFPGSTIGNFERHEALSFLKLIRATCGRDSGLLIGVDLKKDPSILHAAYNDAAGVTAAFNLNLLRRLNRDLDTNFRLEAFSHYAYYVPALARVEMHLVSHEGQAVDLGSGVTAYFDEGESIHTESCHKYTLETFETLLAGAGYRREAVWTDSKRWFSVHYCVGLD